MQTIRIGKVVWPGPIGVGGGLIKNGRMMLEYAHHASAVEVGSITRYLRLGNTGKTVWKIKDLGLWHNAGLPNYGADHLAEDLVAVQEQMTVPWGINIAVSPGITDPKAAAIDIRETTATLLASGLTPDWITLNVASPDTEDSVEMLSEPARVKLLIDAIEAEFKRYDKASLWLKIGPGMTNERLTQLAELSLAMGVEALVCGNTLPNKGGGGWGGQIILAQADAALWWLKRTVGDKLPLIGLGGVMTGKEAKHKLDLGAAVVQVVSALLVRGPEAPKLIETELAGMSRN